MMQQKIFSIFYILEKCREESLLTPFGTVLWESTPVGVKVTLECPYGPFGQYLQRYCWFDVLSQKAEWAPLEDEEHAKCYTKVCFIRINNVSQKQY